MSYVNCLNSLTNEGAYAELLNVCYNVKELYGKAMVGYGVNKYWEKSTKPYHYETNHANPTKLTFVK
ncbi:Hypothetical predicted protein [Octopus vulgaris]|uniref:Uncharacterized protein n=1 Tax=Octopus vulgaris TaxID=6645 RepID=A0AA36FGV1_OCTVU|nr:Hypothetical predicted protein [Octopus vulgaris]